MQNKHAAVVLGFSETGLGVARSLGRNGITVIGLDFYKDVAFYSKYVDARICPHPISEETAFVEYLVRLSSSFTHIPILYITTDVFVYVISRNREKLNNCYAFILPSHSIIKAITDRYKQHQIARDTETPVPNTYPLKTSAQVYDISQSLKCPSFVKCRYTTKRPSIFGNQKGFLVTKPDELVKVFQQLHKDRVDGIVQEVIIGPDTNHFKVCVYISKKGDLLLAFALQKLRQYPIRFGIGVSVSSIRYPELIDVGMKLFEGINYRGPGSAEFKLDESDNRLKLIELNPRYWQQNILADACGMNFPLMQYLDLTGQDPKPIFRFETGVTWVNIYADFKSFWNYRRMGQLSFKEWMHSLRGKTILSDFAFDDILPGFYQLACKFIRLAGLILERAFGSHRSVTISHSTSTSHRRRM